MKLVSLISVASVLLVGLTLQPTLVRAEEPVAAAVAATTDVEATMKKIGFNFKQAMQATDVATMQAKVQSLLELTASVQAYQFTPEDWRERQSTIQTASTEDSSFIGRLWASVPG